MVMEIVFIVIAAFFAGMAVTAGFFGDIKKENDRLNQANERLNNKLHRDVPRDGNGRFTRKK